MSQNRLLTGNCRGLGEVSAISNLKKLCFQHKPNIIFLSETKRMATKMNLRYLDLRFEHYFAIDCVGKGGGLLWTEDFLLQLSFVSQFHIDVEIVDPGRSHLLLTRFYGHPKVANLGFALGFVVDWVSTRSGLALIWIDVLQLHQSHIDIAIGDQGGCRWRLIGFFGQKQKERAIVGEVGGVLQGENATPVIKGALVPLLNFGNTGLQRIGTVRVMVGRPWRRGRCLGLDGGPCPSC
ncbi:hypothetical protein SLA2020_222060 [Shorea laevis]